MQQERKQTFQGNVSCICDYEYKNNLPIKICVDNSTEFDGEIKKLCRAEEIQIYSTMSDTKVSFA